MVAFIGLILLQIVSVVLIVMTIRRLYSYINQYRFDESVYTLLFGFVRLKWFVYTYVLMIAVNSIIGGLFAFSLIGA